METKALSQLKVELHGKCVKTKFGLVKGKVKAIGAIARVLF